MQAIPHIIFFPLLTFCFIIITFLYHNAKVNNISYIKIIFSKIFYDKYDIFQKRDVYKTKQAGFLESLPAG